MGHEASGVILKVGKNVKNNKVGDRVTFDSTIYCGECHFCRRGEINLCDNRRVLGVSCGDYRQHGTFAELVAVPQHILYRLPDDVSFEQAAMVEPCAIAVHAVERTPVHLNDTAVVVGTGMIGLLVIQALRAAGCGKIIAVDIEPEKLELARKLGADYAFNSKTENVVEWVKSLTHSLGADIAFEVVGITAAIQTALDCTRKGGSLTLVGNLSPKIELALQPVVTREITLYGCCASRGEYPACLDLMAHAVLSM
jgi:L-iditol 2-dehydrogenase